MQLIYYDEKGKEIFVKEKIGKGGEGVTYLTKKNKVIKIYRKSKITDKLFQKLLLMVNSMIIHKGICWPEKIVYTQNHNFVGYEMSRAYGKEMHKTLFIKPLFQTIFPNWTRLNLLNLLLLILEKILILHKNNVIIGDINPMNILIKSDTEVFFVDTDSYQIGRYACPVGTVNFTAPEILGRSYKNFLRTIEHESFAVATLIFMVLLPGKPPYSYQGGGNPAENIKQMNFSYPFGNKVNYKAPKGPWEFIWNEMPFEIKEAFYNNFKLDKRLTVDEWITLIEDYKNKIEIGHSSDIIFPVYSDTHSVKLTTSMNRKDAKIGYDKTIINSRGKWIGILELSTKSVKLLIGKDDRLKEEFDFRYFYRKGDLTNTARGLNNENHMNINFFKQYVGSSIKKMIYIAKKENVYALFTVATAVYRSSKNREQILRIIKDEYNLNVRILSKKEEAEAVLDAFLHSGKSLIDSFNKKILLVDQGGGSTEVSFFNNGELIHNYSLNLGTSVLKNVLSLNSNPNTSLRKALKESDEFIKSKLSYYFKTYYKDDYKADFFISVGTVITKATGEKTNRQQHGIIFTEEKIRDVIDKIEKLLCLKFATVGELNDDLNQKKSITSTNKTDNLVVIRVGLPMYLHLMKQFNVKRVIVSGTSLWYGIFFQKVKIL